VAITTIKHPLKCFAQVDKQMEAICNLNSMGRAAPNSSRVFGRAIAADNLYTRMGFQPGCEQFCIPIRQQINRTMLFEINENRSIGMAFAKGNIINAEDTRDWVRWKLGVLHNPEQGIAAGSETQL